MFLAKRALHFSDEELKSEQPLYLSLVELMYNWKLITADKLFQPAI